jgi:hypothetical protein
MSEVGNDNGVITVRCLEARFHPNCRPDEYVVVGTIFCRGGWATCEVAADLTRLPASCSRDSVTANLRYLAVMSRPRPFESLLGMESAHWSFAPTPTRASRWESGV